MLTPLRKILLWMIGRWLPPTPDETQPIPLEERVQWRQRHAGRATEEDPPPPSGPRAA